MAGRVCCAVCLCCKFWDGWLVVGLKGDVWVSQWEWVAVREGDDLFWRIFHALCFAFCNINSRQLLFYIINNNKTGTGNYSPKAIPVPGTARSGFRSLPLQYNDAPEEALQGGTHTHIVCSKSKTPQIAISVTNIDTGDGSGWRRRLRAVNRSARGHLTSLSTLHTARDAQAPHPGTVQRQTNDGR